MSQSKKLIKMLLYAEPGFGKSVFAAQFPKTFFLTSDGNYQWLIDFGADPDAHQQFDSYDELKTFLNKNDFKDYDTLVVDLLEDFWKWSEREYVEKNKVDHVSDIGYGKGYDITRNDFLIDIFKLIGREKNIVLLCHDEIITVKDRRGVEKHTYKPSSVIPDKLLNKIEGRLQFVCRGYYQDTEVDGQLVQKRMLSLVPKSNEYGVIRGVNTNTIPHDIPLTYEDFISAIENHKIVPGSLFATDRANVIDKKGKVKNIKREEPSQESIEDVKEETKVVRKPTRKVVKETEVEETKEETKATTSIQDKLAAIRARKEKAVEQEETKETEDVTEISEVEVVQVVEPKVKVEKKVEKKVEEKTENTKEDKLAAIRAKMAALKAGK